MLQAVVKLTWPVPLAWRLVSNISIPGMSAFLICLLIWRWHGQMAVTKKVMAKYANPVVLILDEWLLLKPTDSEQRDIFELLHRRRKKSSTIFCSQYEFEEWYDQLGGDASRTCGVTAQEYSVKRTKLKTAVSPNQMPLNNTILQRLITRQPHLLGCLILSNHLCLSSVSIFSCHFQSFFSPLHRLFPS